MQNGRSQIFIRDSFCLWWTALCHFYLTTVGLSRRQRNEDDLVRTRSIRGMEEGANPTWGSLGM